MKKICNYPATAINSCVSSISTYLQLCLSSSILIGTSFCFAFTPDGSVPANLDDMMPSSWDLNSVTNQIWVAPGGTGNGSSESNPLGTIQAAIDNATPGTVILVKAGTYLEALAITKSDGIANGADNSPILLISADGPEQAIIQSTGNVSTVRSSRISNWGVIGFKIIGSGSKTSGDNSPIKLGASEITSGDPCNNWLIAGNRISGQGRDGSKYYSGRNIHWIGNTYDGAWGQEACDHVIVGVQDTNGDANQFAFNTVGGSANYTAITLKYGSNNFQIFNNDFTIDAGSAAIRLGGNGDLVNYINEIPYQTEPDFDPQTGVKIKVLYNEFTADVGMNVQFYGSRDCEVSHNNLANPNSTYDINDAIADLNSGTNGNPYTFTPTGNVVSQNKIISSVTDDLSGTLDDGLSYSISGNSSSVIFDHPIGASHLSPHITSLINTLRDGPSTEIIVVQNGDFEAGDNGSWHLTGAEVQSAITYNGSAYAVKVTPDNNYRKAIQAEIPVIAGETLTAEGYMCIDGFDGIRNGLYQLRFYDTDADGAYIGSEASPVSAGNFTVARLTATVNDDWEYVSANDIIVPDDADIMTVWLAAQQSPTGSVYFDDINVYAADTMPGVQLLVDPGFTNYNSSGDWSIHSSASIVQSTGIDGSPGLHQPAGSGYTATSQIVDISGIDALIASGYIKTNNIANGKRALIQVRFYDSNDTKIETISVGDLEGTSSDFIQVVNADIAVPNNASYAKFWIAVSGGSQGEAWFDNLQLNEAP